VDGCGATVFGVPLESAARGYARLASAICRGEEVPRRIADALRMRPVIFGGNDRFDTILLEETDGRVIAKVGAEGVHCALIPDSGVGLAIKVEDGAQRAQHVAVIRVLQRIGALPESLPPRLADLARKPVRNTRNEVVGEIRPVS
jgi:L-asparaginase II